MKNLIIKNLQDMRKIAPQYSSYCGLCWDRRSDTYTRIGATAGVLLGTNPSDVLIPIQAAMRRCVMNDAGEVQYYVDPLDKTKRVGGGTADLTGADGQVMVEIPAFYYKVDWIGTISIWEISLYPLKGFSLHPAFIKNGASVSHRYIGAYEGILYDASAAQYANGLYLTAASTDFTASSSTISQTGRNNPFTRLQVGDKIVVSGTSNNNGTFTVASTGDQSITVSESLTDESGASATIQTEKDWSNDKLSSVSGKAPVNYGTRANFRSAAANRGAGWRQLDYDLYSAIILLYLTEFADWNSQATIGNGLTDWSDSDWVAYNDYNPINATGLSNSLGNTTGNISNGSKVAGSYMSYRGIENLFGHLWKWVDGININNHVPYVSNNDANFADDTDTNYTNLGITLSGSNGYQVALAQIARGFLPISVGGASNTYITDYYWQDSGWRVVSLGGSAHYGAYAGVACLSAHDASSYLFQHVGGRLAY